MTAPAAPRPAATVVLLRDGDRGPEVFLVQRSRSVGFMPSVWVFPGGRVDDGDRLLAGADALARTDAPAGTDALVGSEALASDLAFRVAAARETFEESGFWLGAEAPDPGARVRLERKETTFADLCRAFPLDLSRLVPWSRWVTPAVEPRRFDTRFFVARTPDGDGAHDGGETVASGWFPVAEAADRAESGDLPMAPPTWWTLREVAACGGIDVALAAGPRRPGRPVEPLGRAVEGGFELLLPGHPDHPDPGFEEPPPIPGLPQSATWSARSLTARRLLTPGLGTRG